MLPASQPEVHGLHAFRHLALMWVREGYLFYFCSCAYDITERFIRYHHSFAVCVPVGRVCVGVCVWAVAVWAVAV